MKSPARPRILVYGPFQPPTIACGISSAVRVFAESRVRDVYELTLISTFRQHRNRSLPERLAYGIWLCVRSGFQVLRHRASLADIHAVSDRSLLSHAAILFGTRLAGRPALLRIHGGDFHRVFEQANGIHRMLIKLIVRSASRVIVLSEIWRRRIKAIEPAANVEVIPNSVTCCAPARTDDFPPRQCRNILFLANFCERKGHFDALEALGKLVPRFPDITLLLAGEDRDPGTREQLERRAGQLKILQNIRFLGVISGAEKEEALRNADILILPSHTENMPISVMEGMAFALPVVATSVGALGEMIEDGETGFLVEAKDADALALRLERLIRDTRLAQAMGRKAQQHVRANWDADVVAQRNLDIYSAVRQ